MGPDPFARLPESVEIDGMAYPINSDFRVGVAIEREALGEGEPDVKGLLTLFYLGSIPENVSAAVDQMLWFYRKPTQDEAEEKAQDGKQEKKGGRWYDFGMDSDVLLSSFLSAYGIDLSTATVHWWTFRRLMLNLPPDTAFMQRVHYRVADLSKLSKEQKKHYKKMKALYAIADHSKPKYANVEARDAAILDKVKRRYEEAQNAQRNGPE